MRLMKYFEIFQQYIAQCEKLIRGILIVSLILLIFINPFQSAVSALTEIFFYTALVSACLLTLSPATRPDFSSPLSLPFLLFLGWAFASTFWAFDPENTFHDAYRHLLKHMLVYFMLTAFFVRKEHFLALIWSFIISTAIFSLGAVIVVYILSASPLAFRLNVGGIGPIQIAQFCVFGTLLSLFCVTMTEKRREKITSLTCFIITFSAIILTYSRAALLALGTGCLFLFFTSGFRKYVLLAAAFIFTVSIVIFNLSPGQQHRLSLKHLRHDERIPIYATNYQMIKDRPLAGFGYGAEAYKINFPKFNQSLPQEFVMKKAFPHPHNVFADITLRLGLVGLVLFCWILFRVFKMSRLLITGSKDPFVNRWGSVMTACLISFLTLGLLGNILNSRNAVILYAIMAMITILWKIGQPKTSTDAP